MKMFSFQVFFFQVVVWVIKYAIYGVGITIGLVIILLLVHWAVWILIPPIQTHKLAKTGHFVNIQGIDTYYECQGHGSPVILIPAGGSHTSTWRNNIVYLSKYYQVWTLDLPGSGYSGKPKKFAYTHKSYAEFVKRFMDTAGIKKAVIGGNSLGGTVSLEFSLDYPDNTAGLILIDAGGYTRENKPGLLDPGRYQFTSALLMSFSSYPVVVKTFLKGLYYDPKPFINDSKFISEMCDINRTPNSRQSWYWMPKALGWDFALPDVNRIRNIKIPTLIIWGKNDKIINVEMAYRFHSDIKNSQLTIVYKADHMVHEEKPEQVNCAILYFLLSIKW